METSNQIKKSFHLFSLQSTDQRNADGKNRNAKRRNNHLNVHQNERKSRNLDSQLRNIFNERSTPARERNTGSQLLQKNVKSKCENVVYKFMKDVLKRELMTKSTTSKINCDDDDDDEPLYIEVSL